MSKQYFVGSNIYVGRCYLAPRKHRYCTIVSVARRHRVLLNVSFSASLRKTARISAWVNMTTACPFSNMFYFIIGQTCLNVTHFAAKVTV